MSGGSISEKIKESSGRGAGKWEDRLHKQVEANNLLSDKLRRTRAAATKVIKDMQKAYSLQTTELIRAQARILELEGENEGA